jgi:hypothetical protein
MKQGRKDVIGSDSRDSTIDGDRRRAAAFDQPRGADRTSHSNRGPSAKRKSRVRVYE